MNEEHMITYRQLEISEKERFGEMDRSEIVKQKYILKDDELTLVDVDWNIKPWTTEGTGKNTLAKKLKDWEEYFTDGCLLWGAFDDSKLVGFSGYKPGITENLGQFTLLFVSKNYRGMGIGLQLSEFVIEHAKLEGDTQLYLTPTQFRPTIDFYLALGATVVKTPIPELFEEEQETIVHMELDMFSRHK